MRWLTLTLLLATLGLPSPPASAAKPGRRLLAARAKQIAARNIRIAKAKPWRLALKKALRPRTKSDRVVAERLFLSTYKHYRPATHNAATLSRWAKQLAHSWRRLKAISRRARLKPSDLAWAIYKLTNSDWEPVSCANGGGQNKLRTAKHLRAWGKAIIRLGLMARRAGKEPVTLLHRVAQSTQIKTVAQLRRVRVHRLPSIPKW